MRISSRWPAIACVLGFGALAPAVSTADPAIHRTGFIDEQVSCPRVGEFEANIQEAVAEAPGLNAIRSFGGDEARRLIGELAKLDEGGNQISGDMVVVVAGLSPIWLTAILDCSSPQKKVLVVRSPATVMAAALYAAGLAGGHEI